MEAWETGSLGAGEKAGRLRGWKAGTPGEGWEAEKRMGEGWENAGRLGSWETGRLRKGWEKACRSVGAWEPGSLGKGWEGG